MRLLPGILADTCDWCEPRLSVFAQRTFLYVYRLSVGIWHLSVGICQSAGLLIPVEEHLLDFFDLAKGDENGDDLLDHCALRRVAARP